MFRALLGLVIEASIYADTKVGRKEKERQREEGEGEEGGKEKERRRSWWRGRRGWREQLVFTSSFPGGKSVCLGDVYLFVCLSSLLSPAFSSDSDTGGAPAVAEDWARDSGDCPFVTSYVEGGLKGRRRGFRVSRIWVSTVGQRRAAQRG